MQLYCLLGVVNLVIARFSFPETSLFLSDEVVSCDDDPLVSDSAEDQQGYAYRPKVRPLLGYFDVIAVSPLDSSFSTRCGVLSFNFYNRCGVLSLNEDYSLIVL